MVRTAKAVTLLLGGCLVVIAYHALDRPVRKVQIIGGLAEPERSAVRSQVADVLLVNRGGLLSLDLGSIRSGLDQLGWPRGVSVRRRWPDALVIEVEKASAIARWGSDRWLSSSGTVLTLPGEQALAYQHLPVLDCKLASPAEAMERFHLFAEVSERVDLTLKHVRQNALGEWQITYEQGPTVMLGATDVAARLQRFALAYNRALAARGAALHVDARYQHGIAVREPSFVAARGEAHAF